MHDNFREVFSPLDEKTIEGKSKYLVVLTQLSQPPAGLLHTHFRHRSFLIGERLFAELFYSWFVARRASKM